jgi:hypothetical protein
VEICTPSPSPQAFFEVLAINDLIVYECCGFAGHAAMHAAQPATAKAAWPHQVSGRLDEVTWTISTTPLSPWHSPWCARESLLSQTLASAALDVRTSVARVWTVESSSQD